MTAGSGSAFTDRRRPVISRRYRSHCKICLQAIYEDEKARWSSSPIGLCHEECR